MPTTDVRNNKPSVRETALAAHSTGWLTAFMLKANHVVKGKTTTAFLAQFANPKAAATFARDMAIAHHQSLAIKRMGPDRFWVLVPIVLAHAPNAAAFRLWPADENQPHFEQTLASAGLSMC